ncbi:hypothetical protein Hanom_Chr01g00021881 [Helianthus anomalus]
MGLVRVEMGQKITTWHLVRQPKEAAKVSRLVTPRDHRYQLRQIFMNGIRINTESSNKL